MYIPLTIFLPIDVQVALHKYYYEKEQREIEDLRNEYQKLEKALKRYKENVIKVQEHDLYVKSIRDKKKARRLRNKAKGPRK